MEYLIIIIFFAFLLFTSKYTWPLGGLNAHPVYFVFITQVLVLTLPGVLILTFFDSCAGSITCEIVSADVKKQVMLDYFIVLNSMLLAIMFSYIIVRGRSDFKPVSCGNRNFLFYSLCVTILIIIIKILSVKQVPLFMALFGDKEGAEVQKAAILRGEDGFSFPVLNFMIKYFPLYFYYTVLIAYLKKQCSLIFLLLSFALVSLAMLYDLQKAPVVIMLIGSFWLYWASFGKTKIIFFGGVLSLILIGFLFYISYDFGGDSDYFINAVINRTFIAQNDGMYWVYQFYDFLPGKDIYKYWGIPLAQTFGLPQSDPLSDIIMVVFPNANDSWVNTTTFLLGEAKAIFGDYSAFIASIIVFINVAIVCIISSLLMNYLKEVFYPAIFVMMQTLPLANNITDLLYGRFLFGYLIFMIFPMAIYFISQGKKSSKENG